MAFPVTIDVCTSVTCAFCPDAVKLANDVAAEFSKAGKPVKVVVHQGGLGKPEVKELFKTYGVNATPTLVLWSDATLNDRVRMVGVPSRDMLEKAIKLASGELVVPQKGWWDKFKKAYVTKPVEEALHAPVEDAASTTDDDSVPEVNALVAGEKPSKRVAATKRAVRDEVEDDEVDALGEGLVFGGDEDA